jgi:hypothetical protein
MHYGISEPEATRLQFRGQKHEETRIKLAMMERDYLAELRDVDPERAARKERIIDKLRGPLFFFPKARPLPMSPC